MSLSPFGFFRGAVPVMAADLAGLPCTGIECQLCGDAHVRNLGAYSSYDGHLVFDINDFDETIRGPFEWDVKRLSTSIAVAAGEIGLKPSVTETAVLAFTNRYIRFIRAFARMPAIAVARYQVHRLKHAAPIARVLYQAERTTPLHSLELLTELIKTSKGEQRIFRENKPLLHRLKPADAKEVIASLDTYRATLAPERRHFLSFYRPIDVAFKVVGTGSVGLRDYVIYFEGNGPHDPLFLQIKEEPGSAYEQYLKAAGPRNKAQRVVEGQRAMQLVSDPFLGWTSISERDYLVRQLNDHKASLDFGTLTSKGLIQYATVCGELLARGHARSGDPAMIAGYLGGGRKFSQAILDFAASYAEQNTRDWELLVKSRPKS